MLIIESDLSLEVIENNFKLDKKLIDKYHIESGKTYKECSLRTYEDLINNTHESFRFFKVFKGDVLVGFFGTEYENYVNTIFIVPEFRNKENNKLFFDKIKSIVGDTFYTALYDKNTRAINYYLKNNGNIIDKLDNVVIIKIGE